MKQNLEFLPPKQAVPPEVEQPEIIDVKLIATATAFLLHVSRAAEYIVQQDTPSKH